MNQIFVYGTLLDGEYNNRRYLQNNNSRLLGKTIINEFEMYSLGMYPTIVKSELDITVIYGEVWEVTDNILSVLDRLESYPQQYNRMEVQTKYGFSWVYFQSYEQVRKRDFAEHISSGSWIKYIKSKQGIY